MATQAHRQFAQALSQLPPERHPLKNPQAARKLAPRGRQLLAGVVADPDLHQMALGNDRSGTIGGGPSATDPTNVHSVNRGLGWGNAYAGRNPMVRHLMVGVTAVALTAGQANAPFKATPNVDFKPNRFSSMPGFSGTVSGIQSGVRPQYVSNAAEDADMYQPLSYGGELDLDAVKAAVPINGFVNNGNATAAQTFYGAFIGEAVGVKYRQFTSKLMDGSLGTSGSVSASGTGSLVLTPLIQYTVRKVLLTPGASFSDAFIITSITAGIQNQLMSNDPIPASIFTDLYPLFVDFDPVKPSVPLTIAYQNVSSGAAVLKGSTRGDVDPADLARYVNMSDIGGQPAGA